MDETFSIYAKIVIKTWVCLRLMVVSDRFWNCLWLMVLSDRFWNCLRLMLVSDRFWNCLRLMVVSDRFWNCLLIDVREFSYVCLYLLFRLCDCPNVVITSLYETMSLNPEHAVQLPEAFCPRCVCRSKINIFKGVKMEKEKNSHDFKINFSGV